MATQLVNFKVIRETNLTGEPAAVNVHTDNKIKRDEDGGWGCMFFTGHGTRGQDI
jgi:hypothetical protein